MKLEIQAIPFQGFYETLFSSRIVEEREAEMLQDEFGTLKHIDDWEIDTDDYENAVASNYSEEFIFALNNALNLKDAYELKECKHEIISPAAYNYGNDRLFITVETECSRKEFAEQLALMLHQDEETYNKVCKFIKHDHGPQAGYISFLEDDIQKWEEQLLTADDEQWMYISYTLCYLVAVENGRNYFEDLAYIVHENVTDTSYNFHPTTEEARKEWEQVQVEV